MGMGSADHSDDERDDDNDDWYHRRETTYRIFCMLAILLGAEYSMIIPSLWFYLHDVIKTNHVKFYYDLALAIYYAASALAGLTISVYADRTRNIKQILLVLLGLEIFGSCLYSVYTSVNFVIVARIIQGFGDVSMALVTAEIARVFPTEECTKKIANIVACFSGAFVLSPGLNVLFKYIDFDVCGFHINYGNFPGILMAVSFSIIFAVALNCLSDLSKERDLKSLTSNTRNSGDDVMNPCEFKPWFLFLKFDFILLVFIGFVMTYSIVSFLDVSFPIISSLYFHQSPQFVSGMFLAAGLLFMVVLHVIKKLSKKVNDFTFLIGGLCIFMVSTTLLLCVSLFKDDSDHHLIGLVLLVLFVLLLGICWCVEQVFVKTILAKITPSEVQAFGEGVRRATSSVSAICSSMVTGLIIKHLHIQCMVTLTVTLLAIIVLLVRQKSLKDPQPLVHQSSRNSYNTLSSVE